MFSVLMSVYYREDPKYLEQALMSVINQTCTPSEIVIVRDGILTIELDNVLQYFSTKYSLIKIVNLSSNQGLGKALTVGLLNCSYDLVARMDTDDIAVNDRFEKQVNFLNSHPEISIVGGWIREFEHNVDNVRFERKLPILHKDLVKFMKWRNPFNHMTVMFRKQAILEAGNYKEFYLLEDYYLWARLYLKGYIFANIPEVLVYARAGLDMLSRRGGARYIKSERKLLRFFYSKNIINFFEYIISLIFKTVARLMGAKGRRVLYSVFLRR